MFISCKESRIENNKSFYGCFYLSGFTSDSSQSLTIANALRRSLLSDCTGLAIISVQIENVHHEYSTLTGVKDSVLDIILNFKEIIFKKIKNPLGGPSGYKNKGLSSVYEQVGSTFFKPVVGYLKVKGPGVIRAKDLRLPAFIQCVDPNQYIATLADDGVLNLKVVIMEGKSYYIQKGVNPPNNTKKLNNETNETYDESQIGLSAEEELSSTLIAMTKKRQNLLKQLKNITSKKVPNNITDEGLSLIFDKKTSRLLHKENSKQLNIDAVFNPVTKVNYIIENTDNYIVDSLYDNFKAIDNLTSLIDSSMFLTKNFPYFQQTWTKEKQNKLNKPITDLESTQFSYKPDGSGNGQVNEPFTLASTPGENNDLSNDLLNYITDLPKSELSVLCTPTGSSHSKGIGLTSFTSDLTLGPKGSQMPGGAESAISNQLDTDYVKDVFEANVNISSKQTIQLEIWTNGSLHPRDALEMSLKNLALAFSTDKMKIANPIFNHSTSYKKILQNL